MIPAKYSQIGGQVSPPLAWSNVPDGVTSFVVIAHDADQAVGQATDDTLQWMVWNIPGSARSLDEGMPQGNTATGPRQISATGPYYRGVTAVPGGTAHHYVFEIYALDANITVPAVGQSPAATRAAIEAEMAGKIRARGTLMGIFKQVVR